MESTILQLISDMKEIMESCNCMTPDISERIEDTTNRFHDIIIDELDIDISNNADIAANDFAIEMEDDVDV